MRKVHEAVGSMEVYSPAEELFNRRRRTFGLFAGPALLLVLLVAMLVTAPVLAVVVDGLIRSDEVLLPRGLGSMVVTTVLLMVGVGIGTLLVGGLAQHRFGQGGRAGLGWEDCGNEAAARSGGSREPRRSPPRRGHGTC